jgi:hypothetical protein
VWTRLFQAAGIVQLDNIWFSRRHARRVVYTVNYVFYDVGSVMNYAGLTSKL